MQVFVHAGFHKTGTTSFQNLIRANRTGAPADVYFLLANDPLASELRAALRDFHREPGPDQSNRLRGRLSEILSEALHRRTAKMVISLEVISGLLPDADAAPLYPHGHAALAEICRVFAGHEITVLLSVRDATAWVRSVHAHRLRKPGFTLSLAEFSGAAKFKSIDWDRVARSLTNGLPVSFIVSPLEATADTRLGPCSDFLPLFLAPETIAAWQPVARANTGLTPVAVSLSENRLVGRLPDRLRRFIIRQFNSVAARL